MRQLTVPLLLGLFAVTALQAAVGSTVAELENKVADMKDRIKLARQASDESGARQLQREYDKLRLTLDVMVADEAAAGATLDDKTALGGGSAFACALCELLAPGIQAMVLKRRPEARIRATALELCAVLRSDSAADDPDGPALSVEGKHHSTELQSTVRSNWIRIRLRI
eukprot:SAG11_NODE_3834_length_2196_cov_1.893181_1_plen_169_part_00